METLLKTHVETFLYEAISSLTQQLRRTLINFLVKVLRPVQTDPTMLAQHFLTSLKRLVQLLFFKMFLIIL